MRGLTNFILKRASWITWGGALLTGVGVYFSVELYRNLRTDIEELLPTTARSVVDLNEVSARLKSIDNLAVLVFSDDTRASKRFVDDLANRLQRAPKDTVASVEYRIDRELAFFKDRRALYMELGDLIAVRNYIRDRLEYERQLYNPLNIFRESEIPEPQFDFYALRLKYDQKVSAYSRFPGGYYATPDEKKRVVLVNLPGKVDGKPETGGIRAAYRLKNHVTSTIAELNPASYAADLEIKYTGGVQNTIEEQSALVADLELSTIIVLIVVSIALFYFFRAFRATWALLTAVFMGTAWTFGVSYFAVGYLNANSAFLGAIVLGNGINFGIILLARYLEERRQGQIHDEALFQAIKHTSTSTWTAALAAALAYGSLMLTGFRGFKQFGVIGFIGMVLCWIASFTMLPAILTWYDRRKPLVAAAPADSGRAKKTAKSLFAEGVAHLVQKKPRLIWYTSLALAVASLAMFPRIDGELIEADLTKLRNKKSMTEGSGYLSKHVDEIFQRYLSPVVLLPRSRDDAQEIARRLKELKKNQGESSLIASVQTLNDFIPTHQAMKIGVLKEIRALLPPSILRRMPADQRALAEEFLTDKVYSPVRMSDLPPLILTKFTERDGTIGKLVLVEPPLSDETRNKNQLIRFVRELRETADGVAPGTPVAGSLPVSSDMIEAINRDGPRATLFAFLAVIALVFLLFRNLRTAALILFALTLGVVWMGGIVLAAGLKINFLNFIALPITFGIGVDYGVNVFQRYREEGRGSILKVVRETGGAVALCSFTTAIGYGSLLIADNQAFVSFGILSVLSEVTCVIAAIVSLPAFLITSDRVKQGDSPDLDPIDSSQSPVLRS